MGIAVQSPSDIDTAFSEGAAIVATGLRRSFAVGDKRIDVLRDVSVTIEGSERLFLCGPSGAGKTTLLYTLAGLERPDAGTVQVGERSLYSLPPKQQASVRNKFMGYIFQNYFLLPELTALENVVLPSQIGGRMQTDRARELLDQVGLSERMHHLPAELSGGEQQRVAIARALVNDPRVLFARRTDRQPRLQDRWRSHGITPFYCRGNT